LTTEPVLFRSTQRTQEIGIIYVHKSPEELCKRLVELQGTMRIENIEIPDVQERKLKLANVTFPNWNDSLASFPGRLLLHFLDCICDP